jgi:TonB family protein
MRCKLILFFSLITLATGQALPAAESVAIPKTALAIYAPQPRYPFFALLRHEEGSGIFVFRVDIKTGRVKQIMIAQSTQHKDLDAATVKVLKEWRFTPGALKPVAKVPSFIKDPSAKEDAFVKLPVTFTIR